MSTPLHQRMLTFDYGPEPERVELMRKVWAGHPWIVDTYTGGYSNDRDREHEILTWCYENFGEQASPIHDKPGAWYRGSATVNGWTWMGFTTEADMLKFAAHWQTRVDT